VEAVRGLLSEGCRREDGSLVLRNIKAIPRAPPWSRRGERELPGAKPGGGDGPQSRPVLGCRPMLLRWVLLLICGWATATVSGAAGFGGALLLLPVLAFTVGGKAAVPILTVAQLLGNLSRAGFGWRDILWRPALLFSLGAVPASLLGSRLFVSMPTALILRVIGVLLLAVVALRHTSLVTDSSPANGTE
jgi:Sulfite exporter TauE/SafE